MIMMNFGHTDNRSGIDLMVGLSKGRQENLICREVEV